MSIFKVYDIRGEFKKEIDEQTMEHLGRTIGSMSSLLLSRDARKSGEILEKFFVRGVLSSGADVILSPPTHLGMAGFSASSEKKNLAYITASHLPPEFTGLKMYHKDGVSFSDTENKEIERIFKNKEWKTGQGNFSEEDHSEEYMDIVFEKFKINSNVVVDFGGGACSFYGPRLWNRVSKNASFIFEKPDPLMSQRNSKPTFEGLKKLRDSMSNKDLGIAYDGDGDRVVFFDDKKRIMRPEQVAIFLAKDISSPKIVINIECSETMIREALPDAKITTVPVGHIYLPIMCKEKRADIGVEYSGHFVITEHGYIDDGMMASFDVANRLKGKMSGFVDSLPKYYTERIQIDINNEEKFEKIEELKKVLGEKYDVLTIDGIKINFNDGWVLIRASNTEPAIRVTIETKSEKRLEELKKKFVGLVKK